MDKRMYENLDWGLIEGIRYVDISNPNSILGPQFMDGKLAVIAFKPDAKKVEVVFDEDVYLMEEVDEDVFAVITKYEDLVKYKLRVHYEDNTYEIEDEYSFRSDLDNMALMDYANGDSIDIYDQLGAIKTTIDGVEGVRFSVYAPMAQRVSVVGDFNFWDGRIHQMSKIYSNGIFSIFIPHLTDGELYKYEILTYTGDVILKADPLAKYAELRPNSASIVYNEKYEWNDKDWLREQKKSNRMDKPMTILEVHLGSFMKPEDREFYTYREYAKILADYALKMNYTHIELMPIMEHPYDKSWGYQVTGYYAPTSRFGTPNDFKYMIDYLHQKGIGVILDWVPAHFPKDDFGLARFDGSCVYEHLDPRKGEHPHWGTLIFNYGRNEVISFLISNAMYWLKEFHADGLRVDAVASMLYLDYGKDDGYWVANKYGGNENLEAIEFFQRLNSVIHKNLKNKMIIAEESTAWAGVTDKESGNGLGFTYKWNMGWMNDFLHYMQLDPIYRADHQGELTFSFNYAYSENFILVISHDEVVHLKKSMLYKMPGDISEKFANLRLAYSFMYTHPGKKLLFMGQDFGEQREWAEDRSLDWYLLEDENHKGINKLITDLNNLVMNNEALYKFDCKEKGFVWINGSYNDESLLFFARKAVKKVDTLIIACNFTPVVRKKFTIGVPYAGKYKEIFNSDARKYGGSNIINRGEITTDKKEWDGFKQAMDITVPPLGVSIFKYKGK